MAKKVQLAPRALRDLPRSRLLELVAFVIEKYEDPEARVVFDAKIKELQTGQPRQVDIAVVGLVGRRSFLRIVEVQARGRRATVEFIDRVVGKRQALGAHRATVVTTAGFTLSARERINANAETLDAFELRAGTNAEWPSRWKSRTAGFTMNLEGKDETKSETISLPLEHLRYCDGQTGVPIFDVGVARFLADGVFCTITRVPDEQHMGAFLLPPTAPLGKKLRYFGMTIEGDTADGHKTHTFKVQLDSSLPVPPNPAVDPLVADGQQ